MTGQAWPHLRLGWSDRPAVVIASGPSLADADLECVRRARAADNVRVLSVSNAYKLTHAWADVFFSADRRWWKQYLPHMRQLGIKNDRLLTCCTQTADLEKVPKIRAVNRPGLSTTDIHTGGNSGYMGMSAAFVFGAKRILLLGFDMKLGDKGLKHFDGDHPAPLVQAMPFAEWLRRFDLAVPELRRHGVSVVNCTPGSALRCFPMSTIDKELARVEATAP